MEEQDICWQQMRYGLSNTEWDRLQTVFNRYPDIERAILYGSRAKGNYKPFSDVDITLIGEQLTRSELNRIVLDIDDLLALSIRCVYFPQTDQSGFNRTYRTKRNYFLSKKYLI